MGGNKGIVLKEDIKEWLLQIRRLNKRKRYHLNEIDNIKRDCERIREGKAATMSLAKVQTSNISNPTEQTAIKIVDEYGKKVDYHTNEINRVECSIYKAKRYLETLHNEGVISIEELQCLNYYYFEGMSIEETAIAMRYGEKTIDRKKKSAIEKMSFNVPQLPCIIVL